MEQKKKVLIVDDKTVNRYILRDIFEDEYDVVECIDGNEAIAALKDGKKLYTSYDVGKMLDRKRGYCDTENFDYQSLFATDFPMTKAERISTFDSGSTHAMTLTAVDLDANGKAKKWKVENSWGAAWGQKGCLIMSDRWMREYLFRLVIDKKFVPEKILKANEQKPVMVMPEDPLFGADE